MAGPVDSPTTAQAGSQKPSILIRLAPIVLIAAAFIGFFAFGLNKHLSLQTLQDNHRALSDFVDASFWQALGLFMAAYVLAVAISVPGASILTVFGGFLFGLWPGAPAIVVAATIGAYIVYVATRTAFGESMRERAGGFVKRMETGFRENELSYMLLLRLVPLFPFWAVNIAAGAAGVRTRNFLLGTFLGIIPGSFVYAGVGATAGAAFEQGEDISLSGLLLQPQSLAILGVFIALSLAPIIYRSTKTARSAEPLDIETQNPDASEA
ncbi:MAG: TVP38/TMEM64 family protein [Pseudomonadota bacterium]